MLSHGVDKWYKMQRGSGIPGIRLGMEKHFVVEEIADKDDEGGPARSTRDGSVHGGGTTGRTFGIYWRVTGRVMKIR